MKNTTTLYKNNKQLKAIYKSIKAKHNTKSKFYFLEQTGFDNFCIYAYTTQMQIILQNLHNNNILQTLLQMLSLANFDYIND